MLAFSSQARRVKHTAVQVRNTECRLYKDADTIHHEYKPLYITLVNAHTCTQNLLLTVNEQQS